MHKISLLAALAAGALIAFTPNLQAQEKPARPEGAARGGPRGDMLKEMAEKLDLTAEQKTKLQEAFKAQREAMKDFTPEERRAKMQETRKTMDAKVKEILTAEQYAKWEKLREENRSNRPGGPGGKKAEKK